ncbi:ABC transporter substrate-binding protein [Priestia aryabhattai]|uniref:nickel ABC transporter substrate-binding protein n=1 Tax=Priestia aryabhattai TaxID=412384 RepID=UPI001C0E62EF|nr:nickel ABC transporter substrate-binding protein [Priestia aryabhattai]MBU3571280.1 ABC transporter substrate-binding protein [Priestia aryabhattai]
MTNNKKLVSILIFVLLCLTACTPHEESMSMKKEEKTDKSATFLFNFTPATLDPHTDDDYTAVRAGVGETLVKISDDLKVKPWLAEKWETKDNGLTWTFAIRKNITFQNGKALDASAVKPSLQRVINQSYAMRNALKIKEMKANGHTLTITLKEPIPKFPSELVHPNTAIIDVDASNIAKKPIGTGPFRVLSFDQGNQVKLGRYEHYWNGKVKLKKAIFAFNEDANARVAALQSGTADIIYRPPLESLSTLQTDPSFKVSGVPSVRTHLLLYNQINDPLKDENVRKTIDALLNRKEIVSSIMNNQAAAARGPFLPQFPFADSTANDQRGIASARKYLEKAGYQIKNGKAIRSGKPLSLSLVTYSSLPELPLIAQLIQSNAKELGININIHLVEDSDEYLMAKDDWDLALYSLITAPRGDASYYLSTNYLPGGGLNASRINDDKLSKMIHQLNSTVDDAKRDQLAKQATALINRKMLTSSIVHPNIVVAYNQKVKNWTTNPSEYYMLTQHLDVTP